MRGFLAGTNYVFGLLLIFPASLPNVTGYKRANMQVFERFGAVGRTSGRCKGVYIGRR